MSNSSYTSTRTRSARLALQDKAQALRSIRAFSYEKSTLMLARAPAIERDFSLTTYITQQQDWCAMHRGAVASVASKQYRATCYPLPVEVTYIRKNHKKAVNLYYLS